MTQVKVCGLTNREDAEFAMSQGAHYLGFVLEPASPRYVGNRLEDFAWIQDIRSSDVWTVGVFGVARAAMDMSLFRLAQAVEWENDFAAKPRLQVIRPRPDDTVESVLSLIEQLVPGSPSDEPTLLLDAYNETTYGGTGHKVDWGLAAEIVAATKHKVFLAGGLNPNNVEEAIQRVKPFGVDASSGLESQPGIKDPEKVAAYIRAAGIG